MQEKGWPYYEVRSSKEAKHPLFDNIGLDDVNQSILQLHSRLKELTGGVAYVRISKAPRGSRSPSQGAKLTEILDLAVDLDTLQITPAEPIGSVAAPGGYGPEYLELIKENERLRAEIRENHLQRQIDDLKESKHSPTADLIQILAAKFGPQTGTGIAAATHQNGIAGNTPEQQIKSSLQRLGRILGDRTPEVLEDLAQFVERHHNKGDLNTYLSMLKSSL